MNQSYRPNGLGLYIVFFEFAKEVGRCKPGKTKLWKCRATPLQELSQQQPAESVRSRASKISTCTIFDESRCSFGE